MYIYGHTYSKSFKQDESYQNERNGPQRVYGALESCKSLSLVTIRSFGVYFALNPYTKYAVFYYNYCIYLLL